MVLLITLLFFFSMALLCGLLIWLVRSSYLHYSYRMEIDRRFQHTWNGRPEDEIYAWFRVRASLPESEESVRERRYIDRQIEGLERDKFVSHLYVDRQGRLCSASPEETFNQHA